MSLGTWLRAPLLAIALIGSLAQVVVGLEVGFGSADITPEIDGPKPVWLAGVENNRDAREIHDRLFARAVVLRDGSKKLALVSVDSIGLPRPSVERARAALPDFDYVLVASTHSHASPDVVGIWGPSQGESGVDPRYLRQVEDGIVRAVTQADKGAVAATAEYASAKDESLLGDYRLPKVYDGVMRLLRFTAVGEERPLGIVVQWNSHGVEPRKNHKITRDFMGVVVDTVAKRRGCPAIYFQGAIGGLMGTPDVKLTDASGDRITDPFQLIDAAGTAVAALADRALATAEPIALEPIEVHASPIMVPLANAGFRAARAAGVLKRDAFEWTGSAEGRGKPIPEGTTDPNEALETEVAYLRLGELDLAAIPGEIYPELVYGEIQEPADPGADFPDAELETPIAKILPGKQIMIIGLANDEIGYILPKRQWDVEPPFAFGRDSPQYGEVNSVGPDTARYLLESLAKRVDEAPKRAGAK